MTEPEKPLLEIKDLHTRFHTLDGVVKAVDGIDFEVYPGETLGLVGESGCGKSVTALSILQLLPRPPAEIQGRIFFEGKNLLDLDQEDVRKIRGDLSGAHDVFKPGFEDRRTDIGSRQNSQKHDASRGLALGGGNVADGPDPGAGFAVTAIPSQIFRGHEPAGHDCHGAFLQSAAHSGR